MIVSRVPETVEFDSSKIHSVRFISNDVIERLVDKIQFFIAVAYFLSENIDSRCLFSSSKLKNKCFFANLPYFKDLSYNF